MHTDIPHIVIVGRVDGPISVALLGRMTGPDYEVIKCSLINRHFFLSIIFSNNEDLFGNKTTNFINERSNKKDFFINKSIV